MKVQLNTADERFLTHLNAKWNRTQYTAVSPCSSMQITVGILRTKSSAL